MFINKICFPTGSNSGNKTARIPKIVCEIQRRITIQSFGWIFAALGLVFPELAINYFGYFPASWILHIFNGPFKSYWFAKAFTFFGNFAIWVVQIRVTAIGSIEMIIGSVSLAVLVQQADYLAKNVRYPTEKMVRFYRNIQMLTDVLNDYQSHQLIALLVMFGTAQVAATLQLLYISDATLTPDVSSSMMQKFFTKYWVHSFNIFAIFSTTPVIICLFGFCGQVHYESQKFQQTLKILAVTHKQSKEFRKIIQSIPEVKVKFGRSNFVEKSTPVVFQMFLMEKTVDILLTNKTK